VAAACSSAQARRRAVEGPALYRPRRPAESVLYRVVQEHLETYLARAREGSLDTDPVPRFIEREFRRYLECGILAHGFARARCSGCGHDFLIAFSCKGRGICPSCNARRMAQAAAHLVEQVFPRQPLRQWVLSVPKRLRYFLHHDPAVVSAVLHIFLRVVEQTLRQSSPGAGSGARFGAVSFLHRFGSALNPHVHFHCCVIDGVFQPDVEGRLCFYPALGLTQERIAKVQEQVRRRVLRAFVRRGLLEPGAARDMRGWDAGGGFSVDASIRVQAHDRVGLERLLRYCARPPFALERLGQAEDQALIYRLPKPMPNGQTQLRLTPLELLDRLAALIPPPRVHRHRYHGVLAPNAPWRAQVTAGAAAQAPSAAAACLPPGSPGGEHRGRCRRDGAPIVCHLAVGDAAGENLRGVSAGLSALWGAAADPRLRHRYGLGHPRSSAPRGTDPAAAGLARARSAAVGGAV
jgi:hypothetical protein